MIWLDDLISGFQNGLREVWANKIRSLLSMSGIVLGVAALVTMLAIAQGMLAGTRASFEYKGGIRKLEVVDQAPLSQQRHIAGVSPGRTLRDAQAIEAAIPLAQAVVPMVDLKWQNFRNGGGSHWDMLIGTVPELMQTTGKEIEYGRFISDLDVERKTPVIVIGHELREKLFPKVRNAVGRELQVRQIRFRIIGQFKHVDSRQLWRYNRVACIPVTTALQYFRKGDAIDKLDVLAESVEAIPDLIEQIENTLLQTHRGISDFAVRTQEEQLQEMKKLERSFAYSLGGIAAISLFVGGLGIMNVMLASVSERIREIGVRQAIGARGRDIFLQFLAEAMVISVLGGILGLVLSLGFLSVAETIIPEEKVQILLPVNGMLLGFVFSICIGLLSGIYPAVRAARLDPIEALRYE